MDIVVELEHAVRQLHDAARLRSHPQHALAIEHAVAEVAAQRVVLGTDRPQFMTAVVEVENRDAAQCAHE